MPMIEIDAGQYMHLIRATYAWAQLQANVDVELAGESALDHIRLAAASPVQDLLLSAQRFGFEPLPPEGGDWPEWTRGLVQDAKKYLADYVQIRMWERIADGVATHHYDTRIKRQGHTREEREAAIKRLSDRIVAVFEEGRTVSAISIKGVTDQEAV